MPMGSDRLDLQLAQQLRAGALAKAYVIAGIPERNWEMLMATGADCPHYLPLNKTQWNNSVQ